MGQLDMLKIGSSPEKTTTLVTHKRLQKNKTVKALDS